jgi:hypothetical protein
MTWGQALVIAGLDFHPMRVLILFGLARILARRELFGIKLNAIDGVLIASLSVTTLLYSLFDGTNVSPIGRLGAAYNALGTYILVRASVRTIDDIVAVVKAGAVVIIPLAVLFVVESVTGRNPFAALGGVPELSEIRNGRVRCQGPFLHSILAGTFGATAWPPLVGLWVYGRNRVLAFLAIVAATTIVITSGSSGPLSAFAISTAGLVCWFCRDWLRPIRWGLVIGVLGLALVMKAPVWFLIDRLSNLTGGAGWYRSALIDAAVNHFDEWWLIGTGYTAHWMPTGIQADANSADLVNEFVAQGVEGGLLALLLFIWLIVKCFKAVGTGIASAGDDPGRRFVIWSLGCGLLAHVASFFSVSYFDQITICWYLQIGLIAALVTETRKALPDRAANRIQEMPIPKSKLSHFRAPTPAGSRWSEPRPLASGLLSATAVKVRKHQDGAGAVRSSAQSPGGAR